MKHRIKLVKISTTEQVGDLFTKRLLEPGFEHLRNFDGMIFQCCIDT